MNKYVVRCLDRNGYGKQKWMGYALGLSAARSMVDNMSGAVLGLSYDNAMGAFCAWHDGKMYYAERLRGQWARRARFYAPYQVMAR